MQKNTVFVISALVVVTAALVLFAFQSQSPSQNKPATTENEQPVRQPVSEAAQTTLSLMPDPVLLNPDNTGTIDVIIDTKSNQITAVQLETKYDPKVLTNVKVVAGDFIAQPIVLINKVDAKAGAVTFALGINPTQQPVIGKGLIARITFEKIRSATVQETKVSLLDTSLVTSSGITGSVLKTVTGTTVKLTR